MKRNAFTMMELIFVIVIMGIIAKFGIDMLIKAYDNYTFSTVQNRLQQATGMAVEEIANRLEYRIKPSVIVRNNSNNNLATNFQSLSNAANNPHETILEWVGYDDVGFRGTWNSASGMNMPAWSGFIDLDNPNHTHSNLISPETNTTEENNLINALSGGTRTINDAAIFFIGGNSDINGYGYNHVAIADQNETAHPIDSNSTVVDILSKFAAPNDFTGQSVYEFYQLAWTAYALVYTGDNNTSENIPYISSLDAGVATNTPGVMLFDTNGTAGDTILPHGVRASTQNGGWIKTGTNQYTVHIDNANVAFTYDPTFGTFTCNTNDPTTGNICKRLTK